MLDTENWPARKKLKHSLLRRAFAENRGAEVILLIQWRLAQENHKNEGYVKIARKFLEENACQPRAIRALNLIAELQGLKVTYKDVTTLPEEDFKPDVLAYVRNMKTEDRIQLPEKPETYRGTPDQFGIRRLTDEEQILRNSRKPYGEQRDVRMEALPTGLTHHGSLALLAADKAPPGYKLN